jgi:hypothetical protein
MAAQQQERLEVPAGGIADFAKTDEEIAELEALEAQEDFGNAGIANFSEVAGRMAGYGRFGDDSVAHVKTGEIIVPKELIDNNPRLKEQIFAELMEAGIEDPEQYVVGSSANRINPDTGLPEFGFFSKLWKKLKKAVKKVVGVVLPVVLSMVPVLGPVLGAALGSGIATLVQGGDIKDAFKSAALSGITAGIFKGFTGKGTFMENVRGALPGGTPPPGPPTGETPADIKTEVIETAGSGSDTIVSEQLADATRGTTDINVDGINFSASADPRAANLIQEGFSPSEVATFIENNPLQAAPSVVDKGTVFTGDSLQLGQSTRSGEPSLWDKTKNWLSGRDTDVTAEMAENQRRIDAKAAYDTTEARVLADTGDASFATKQAGAAYNAALNKTPGLLKQYSRPLMVGTGILAATGGFKTPEQEDIGIIPEETGEDLVRRDPGKYLVSELGYLRLNPETGQYEDIRDQEEDNENTSMVASSMMRENPYLDFPQYGNPPVNVARGGAMYPRRTGGIMPYEGTPDEDSVRALLMPGEFVMTTDAVRGAGNGNLNQGINNMYGIMRNLERVGRVA